MKNVRRLYLLRGLQMALFIMPVIVLFWTRCGLDLTDIMLLQVVFSGTIIALEVPTGYLADLLGRKRTLVAGYAVATAGMIAYSVGSGFWSFLAAETLLGTGLSLLSGTDTALLYDSLKAEGREDEFAPAQAHWMFVGQVSEAGAAMAGGLLADVDLRLPFRLTAAAMGLGFLVTFGLTEPPAKQRMSPREHAANLRAVLASMAWSGPLGRTIALYSVLSSATLTAVWLLQPHWEWTGVDVGWFGFLWAALNLAVAFSAKLAPRVEAWLGRAGTLLAASLLPALAYAGLGAVRSMATIPLAFAFQATRGATGTLVRDEMNRHAASEMRATVNSVANLGCRLVFSLVALPIGWAGDAHGLAASMASAAAAFGLLGPASWFAWRRSRASPAPARSA